MKNIKIKGFNFPYSDKESDKAWGTQVTDFAEGIAEAVNEDYQTIQELESNKVDKSSIGVPDGIAPLS